MLVWVDSVSKKPSIRRTAVNCKNPNAYAFGRWRIRLTNPTDARTSFRRVGQADTPPTK